MSSSAMTEVVHVRRGAVRVTGDLTAQGADLLRGTVESLARGGARRVVVDLREVRSTDPAGMHVLRDVERTLAADGAQLVVRPPEEPAADLPRPRPHRDRRPGPVPS
ncbi:STAS domain-containing protein [Blastococcus sp. SYSU D00813]